MSVSMKGKRLEFAVLTVAGLAVDGEKDVAGVPTAQ